MSERAEGGIPPQEAEKEELFDVRHLWGVIEHLTREGDQDSSEVLLEFVKDPVIEARLDELTKAGNEKGVEGARRRAMEAVEEVGNS